MELISQWQDYLHMLLIPCMNATYKVGTLEILVKDLVSYQKELNSSSGQELNFMMKCSQNMDGNIIMTLCKDSLNLVKNMAILTMVLILMW